MNRSQLYYRSFSRQGRLRGSSELHKVALQKNHIVGSAGKVAVNLLIFLETDTMQTFFRRLRVVSREHCSLPLRNIQLKSGIPGKVLGGLLSKLQHRGGGSQCTIESRAYPERLPRGCGNVPDESRNTLKNKFVVVTATLQIPKRIRVAKVTLLCKILTT